MSLGKDAEKFFLENRDVVTKIIDAENERCVEIGNSTITKKQFEEIILEMMAFVDAGSDLGGYKISDKIRTETVARAGQNKKTVSEKGVEKSVSTKNKVLSFEVLKCKNGFVLNVVNEAYIFNTKEDMTKILGEKIFKEKRKK